MMVIESPTKSYKVIGWFFHGIANDSYICTIQGEPEQNRFAVNVLSDRKLARKVIGALESSGRRKERADCFTWQENLCVVFPYNGARSFEKFLLANSLSREDCGRLARNIVMECLVFQGPYPILRLVLRQKKLNLLEDYRVSFNFCLDFKYFDERTTEQDCVREAAGFLIALYEANNMTDAAGFQILKSRRHRNACYSFLELYNDLENADLSLKKENIFIRAIRVLQKKKALFFDIMKYFLIALAVLAAVMLVSQFVIGDIPFLRIFTNTFKKIGDRVLGG